MIKLVRSVENQYGWAVSLTKWEGDECISGYILRYFTNQDEQRAYVYDLSSMFGWLIDDHMEGR